MIETDLPLSLAEGRRQGWPRPVAVPEDSGVIYYCRYFALADGATPPRLAPAQPTWTPDTGFNTFRGDNRTYAIILLVPATDRDLRRLRDAIGVDGGVRGHPSARRAPHPPGTGTRSPASCRWAGS